MKSKTNEVIPKSMDLTITYFDLLADQPDIARWFKVLKQEVQLVEDNINELLIGKTESHDVKFFLASIQQEEQNLLKIFRTSWKSFQLEYRLMRDTERKKRYKRKYDRYEIKFSELKDLLEKSKNISENASWETDDDSCSYSKEVDEKKSISFETVSAQNDHALCHMIDNISKLRTSLNKKVKLSWEEKNGSSLEEKRFCNSRRNNVYAKRHANCSQKNIFEERDDQVNARFMSQSSSDPFTTCLGAQVMRESWIEFWK